MTDTPYPRAKLNPRVDVSEWAKSIVEEYWVPAIDTPNDYVAVLERVTREYDAEQMHAFVNAFRSLTANLKSLQLFLALPIDLASHLFHEEARSVHVDDRIRRIAEIVESPRLRGPLLVMKQQAVVLLWSAYETFVRDVCSLAIDADPSLYGNLMKSPFKDRFSAPHLFSFSALEAEGFSLNGKLGALLVEERDFSSPHLLRSFFKHLFPQSSWGQQLSKLTESRELWLLGNRRHLVAHRCGIVDEAYLRSTGDTQEEGQALNVKGGDIDACIVMIGSVALLVLLTWGSHLKIEFNLRAP